MSYQGPDGPRGPTGLQGTQGQQGLQGPGFGPQGASYFSTTYGLSAYFMINIGAGLDIVGSSGLFALGIKNGTTGNDTPTTSTGTPSAQSVGCFIIITINAEGGSGFQIRNNNNNTGKFNYNGTVTTGANAITVTGSPGDAFILVWDGLYFAIL